MSKKMKYLLNIETVRQADNDAINKFGICGIILMENAARSVAEFIKNKFDDKSKIKIFCGAGNNGGDGFAIARHLISDFDVEIFQIGSVSKMSPETRANYEITQKLKISTISIVKKEEIHTFDFNCDIIIDAMIGVGGTENLKGIVCNILDKINNINAIKIAVDLPTGLNADSGEISKHCFKADYTITMFAGKIGMYLNDGRNVCGRIIEADLGAPNSIIKNLSSDYILQNEDIKRLLGKREKNTSKFDYGRVIVIAGSANFPGAAALSTNATVKAGAGLVELISPIMHHHLIPEVIFHKAKANNNGFMTLENIDLVTERLDKATTLIVGPGIGNDKDTLDFIENVLNNTPPWIKIIIDADALRVVNKLKYISERTILTPHIIEFSRMFDIPISEVQRKSYYIAKEKAKELGCVILLKNVPSIITDGLETYLNIGGNPGMATGGSGDVLSGIIGAMSAQGLDALEAAAIGSFLHSKSGDMYAKKYSEQALSAGNLIEFLKYVF